MFWLIVTAAGLLVLFFPGFFSSVIRLPVMLTRIVGIVIFLIAFLSTSYVVIDADNVGHLKRVYFGRSMPPGRIIAFSGENGPQAEVLAPGLNIRPFLNVLYDVQEGPVLEVPAQSYGLC